MKIIFLDIDGVLNAHEYDPEILCGQIHGDKIALLNGVLRETGAKIVISSAWRYIVHRGEANLVGMEWLLRSHGLLAGRLAGITRRDTIEKRMGNYSGNPCEWPVANERGAQISDWIADNPTDSYVAIDDLDLGISLAGHPLVLTDGKRGLTRENAIQAVEILLAVKKQGGPAMTPLPPDWATLQQPVPQNHGTPAIDALRPGQPLREVVGDFLADAAIARAEKIGLPTYGSLLTANNGRNQPVEILQEAADIPGALVAWMWEITGDDSAASDERRMVCRAISELYEMTVTIRAAAMLRAKRLAKGEKP